METHVKLKEFMTKMTQERNLSLRKVATGIDLPPSHLSAILNGKRPLRVAICNSIADYFEVPRIELYNQVGWVDLSMDEELINKVKELGNKEPTIKAFLGELVDMNSDERARLIRVIQAAMKE